MGKIFVLMGKSATGKDTIFKRLISMRELGLQTVVGYTTRPIRSFETDGVEYFFVTEAQRQELLQENKVIETRTYHTMLGDWHYFTANDGQIDVSLQNYLFISTLEGYEQIRNYYGKESVVPIYIEVEDGIRLRRALDREQAQDAPKYDEMCRRYLADQKDFTEENIRRLEIASRYQNTDVERCIEQIVTDIKKRL